MQAEALEAPRPELTNPVRKHMGKSEDYYTPTAEQRAAAEKIVVRLDYTPEQLAATRRQMADRLREGAEMDRISERLDRAQAIRDGLIPPPWAGKPPTDKEPLKAIERAKVVLHDLYPTKAKMPNSLKAATQAVNDECQKRGWQLVTSTDTVHRAAEQLGYRPPRKRQ